MRVDQGPGDGKPEPRPASPAGPCSFTPVEPVEHVRGDFLGHARPCVGDRQLHAVARGSGLQPELGYHRATLALPGDALRVTVDVGVAFVDAETGQRTELSDVAIVETKTLGGPSAVDRAL